MKKVIGVLLLCSAGVASANGFYWVNGARTYYPNTYRTHTYYQPRIYQQPQIYYYQQPQTYYYQQPTVTYVQPAPQIIVQQPTINYAQSYVQPVQTFPAPTVIQQRDPSLNDCIELTHNAEMCKSLQREYQ